MAKKRKPKRKDLPNDENISDEEVADEEQSEVERTINLEDDSDADSPGSDDDEMVALEEVTDYDLEFLEPGRTLEIGEGGERIDQLLQEDFEDQQSPQHTVAMESETASGSLTDAGDTAGLGSERVGSGTIDSGAIDSSQIREMWKKLAGSDANPMMSIEAPAPEQAEVDELTLNERFVAEEDTKQTDATPDYRIVRFLAKGNMGEVHVAHQTSTNREVAFKRIKKTMRAKESRRKQRSDKYKFLFEAQITANLNHPNIVAIHDLGKDQSGNLFYCMELVHGKPWEASFGELSLEDNLDIWMKIADGVAYAHSKDIIHRDLKPENVMLGNFGEVLIMDWGLAVDLSRGKPSNLAGTPVYLSPEMAKGPKTAINKISDVYLLGAILFHITTGHPPHPGASVSECISAAATNTIVDVDEMSGNIDRRLLAIAMKALETRPEDRYESVESLTAAISEYRMNHESIQLVERSQNDLRRATEKKDYELFSKSLFGFKEAEAMWEGNAQATQGVQDAKLAYADCAYANTDFDLGLSLLDESKPAETALAQKIQKAAKQRDGRKRLLRLVGTLAVTLLLAMLVVIFLAADKVAKEQTKTLAAYSDLDEVKVELEDKQEELKSTQAAIVSSTDELTAKNRELESKNVLLTAKQSEIDAKDSELSDANANLVKTQSDLAMKASELTDANEKVADANKMVVEKQAELAAKTTDLRKKTVELEGKDAEISKKVAELATKDAELVTKDKKLNTVTADLEEAQSTVDESQFQADISLIDGQIRDNQIEQAVSILKNTKANSPELINWEWYRLFHLCHTEFASQNIPNAVRLDSSNDGSTAAIVTSDGKVKIWDIPNNRLSHDFDIGDKKVLDVSISSDGKLAVIGSANNERKLTVWNIIDGKMVADLSNDANGSVVSAVMMDPTGNRIAAADSSRNISLWKRSGDQWEFEKSLKFHSRRPVDLDFSSDGKRLASVSEDGMSIVWDIETGKPFSAYRHDQPLHSIAFQPTSDGMVAVAATDRKVVIWDSSQSNDPADWQALDQDKLAIAQTNAMVDSFTAHESRVNELKFSSDGITLLTGGADRSIAVWDFARRQEVKRFHGHIEGVTSCGISADGKTTVSVSKDGQVRFYSINRYEDERVFASGSGAPANSIDISEDGKRLLTTDDEGKILVWDRDRQGQPVTLVHGGNIGIQAHYLPKSNKIVTTGTNRVCVWQDDQILVERTDVGNSGVVAVTSDEKMMITGGDENHPTIVWDIESGDKLATLMPTGGRYRATSMSVSSDDRYLVVGHGLSEAICCVFDLKKFELVDELEAHRGWITDVVFSPTELKFITADSIEGYVNVWSIVNNRLRHEKKIEDIIGSYIRIAFSPDGSKFVTSANDDQQQSSIKVWDSQTLQMVADKKLPDPINFVSYVNRDIVFRYANGRTHSWNAENDETDVKYVSSLSSVAANVDLNGWQAMKDNRSLVYGTGFAKVVNGIQINSVVESAGNPGRCLKAKFVGENQVASIHEDGLVRIWDVDSQKVMHIVKSDDQVPLAGFDVNPDRKLITVYQPGGLIRTVDVATGTANKPIDMGSRISTFNWVSEKLAITGSPDGKISILDVTDGDTKQTIELSGSIESIDSLKDMKTLVCIVRSGSERLAYLLTRNDEGKWVQSEAFTNQVSSAKLSHDGKRIFTGDNTGTITVWYLPTERDSIPRKLISLTGHQGVVSSIALSSDGRDLVSAARDGKTIFWLSNGWN